MQKTIRRIILILLVVAVSYQFICIEKIGRDFKNFFNSIYETIEPKPNFEKYKRATVEIKVGRKGGAGVIVKITKNNLYILTAKHIIEQTGKIEIQFNLKEKIRIKNVNRRNILIDDKVDLALIKINKPSENMENLPISKREIKQGDKIYTIGHPLNFHYTITEGIVSNTSVTRIHKNNKIEYLMISSPSFAGNSGGAVVNSRGELIRIVVGIMYVEKEEGWTHQTIYLYHMTFAVKIRNMQNLLKKGEDLDE